jgi:hypothetical protein
MPFRYLHRKYAREQKYQVFPTLNSVVGGVKRTIGQNPHLHDLHKQDLVKEL